MIPFKETKELLYKLFQERLISLQVFLNLLQFYESMLVISMLISMFYIKQKSRNILEHAEGAFSYDANF